MNCDEAFERLTSPPESDNGPLERHLNECARCRAMQEALSPAIAWLAADADLPESRDESPRWHLSEEAVRIAERTSRRLQSRPRAAAQAPRAARREGQWFLLAAVVVLVLFAVWLPPERTSNDLPSVTTSSAPAAISCTWQMAARVDRGAPAAAEQVIASCVACHLATP